MKKLFVILFSLVLFISCDSMDGDFETSIQKISEKEILNVQNAKKDTVKIVIDNKDGFVYIIENDKIVAKTIIENELNYIIVHSEAFIGLIFGLILISLITGLFIGFNNK